MQSYNDILDSFTLQESRLLLLNNILTALSNSSGSAFPTANLQVGMSCFRTDLNQIYNLTDLTPTWELQFDFNFTPTNQEYVDNNALSSSGDVSTGNQEIIKASPEFALERTNDGSPSTIRFRDSSGFTRGRIRLEIDGTITLGRNNASGALQTLISLTTDGNVLVNGASPTNAAHLTRRDYVNAQDATTLSSAELYADSAAAAAAAALIPAGTKMIFIQAAAPAGWTQDATLNDRSLRVVSSSGGGTGGSWTISGLSAANTTITEAQMPGHTHTATRRGAAVGFPGGSGAYLVSAAVTSGSTGGGTGHSHTLSSNGAWRPAYVNAIACTKN